MRETRINKALRRLHCAAATIACGLAFTAQAAVPGISGPNFKLQAAEGYISQPDGTNVYTWGYGCDEDVSGRFLPSTISGKCSSMQQPGPTLIVNAGQTVSVTLRNNLPKAAGNTSILFPGFDDVTATVPAGETVTLFRRCHGDSDAPRLPIAGAVTYTFTASRPGTYAYYSGTQGDLQIEMGLYGALIVLPSLNGGLPNGYTTRPAGTAQNPTFPNTCVGLNGAVRAVASTTASLQRPTTIRRPATTASTCSSCRRWISRSITRPSSRRILRVRNLLAAWWWPPSRTHRATSW